MKNKRNIIILVIALVVVMVGAVMAVMAVGSRGASDPVQQLTLAQRYLDEQNYEQAVIEFERLIEIDPKNADAYIGLARAYKAMGEHDKAAEVLEKALAEVDEADAERIGKVIEELSEVIAETAESATSVSVESEAAPEAEEETEEAKPASGRLQLAYLSEKNSLGEQIRYFYIAENGNYVREYYKSGKLINVMEFTLNEDGSLERVVRDRYDKEELKYSYRYVQVYDGHYEWLTYANGSYSYEYDFGDDGVLLSMTEVRRSDGRETICYFEFITDSAGRVTERIITGGGEETEHIYYTYDDMGRVVEERTVTSDSERVCTMEFDENGELVSEKWMDKYNTSNNVSDYSNTEFTYTYYPNGTIAEEAMTVIENMNYMERIEKSIVRYSENGMLSYEYYYTRYYEKPVDEYDETIYGDDIGYEQYVYEEISEISNDEWGNVVSESYEYTTTYDDGSTEAEEGSTKYETKYVFGDNGLPVSGETWVLESYENYYGNITHETEPYLISNTEYGYIIIE